MSSNLMAGRGCLRIGGVICHSDGTHKTPLSLSAEVPETTRRRFFPFPSVLVHNNSARNVLADALVDLFDAGTLHDEGRIRLYTEGGITLLATVLMANPAFGSAVTGVAQGSGLPWRDYSANGAGYASEFVMIDRDENPVLAGEVAADAEMTFLQQEIAVNDIVKILTASYTAPP